MFKIYLDSADQRIGEWIEAYSLDGATSNPTILEKGKCSAEQFVSYIPEGKAFFIQLVSRKKEEMIEEAIKLKKKHPGVIVKIPVTREGIQAIPFIEAQKIPTLATAVYSLEQAALAIHSGCSYVAPYVNRICNLGIDGVEVALSIQSFIRQHGYPCRVVAASFKNLYQVQTLIAGGIDSITISLELFEKMVDNINTDLAVRVFEEDAKKLSKVKGFS